MSTESGQAHSRSVEPQLEHEPAFECCGIAEHGDPSWLQSPSARGRCKTRHVIDLLRFVSGLAADLGRRRVELVAENALLRQHLIVAEQKIAGRIRWTPRQRLMIVLAARVAPTWREATLLIQPATLLRWHRAGFRAFWRRRSQRPDDRRRRVPRSFARWQRATHAGVPSASLASCSS